MPVFLIIFLLMLIIYAVLIDYYRRAWNQIPDFEKNDSSPSTSISVIIAVRNEANNIEPLLQSLQTQSYPKNLFEVIIIDDYSEDETWSNLCQFKSTSLRISLAKLSENTKNDQENISFKKKAIETGIGLATGTLMVTTDADCTFHEDWLLTIARFYEDTSARFIAAPVKIKAHSSLLSVFQTLDFLTLQGVTGGSVFKRIHSMCNGANLAYEKEAFELVDGFAGIDSIPSGDDLLLMHKIYKKFPGKVFYLKSNKAIVTTAAVSSWNDFLQQRIRWASKAVHYDDKRIFRVLLLVYLVNSCFLVLGIASFFNTTWFIIFLLLLTAKVLIEFPFVNAVSVFFHQQSLMKYFPFLQPLHIIYTIIAGWFGRFNSFEWKGRLIKK